MIIGVVVVIALRGSSTKYDPGASKATAPPEVTTPEPTSASTSPTVTTVETPASGAADGEDYTAIIGPTNEAKSKFLTKVFVSGRATPQFEVNQEVTEFVSAARRSVDELAAQTWSPAAAGKIEDLVRVYNIFIDDVDLLRYSSFLYSDSFFDKLRTESDAVRQAAIETKEALGLS